MVLGIVQSPLDTKYLWFVLMLMARRKKSPLLRQVGYKMGRPVDLEQLPDGSVLVSDDFADVIYRIYYENLLKETLQLFQDKKAEMKELVLNFSHLSEKERNHSWQYLEVFFKETENLTRFSRLFPKETNFQDVMKLEKRRAN